VTPEERQAVLDEEHLRLLALFHYISGGVTIAFSLMFAMWALFAGAIFATLPAEARAGIDEAAARQLRFMPLMFGVVCAVGIVYGIVEVIAGRLISQRRGRLFAVIAGLPRVMFVPHGAVLTVFTLLVLDRPSVQALYRRQTTL
jgi:hypothetical protein